MIFPSILYAVGGGYDKTKGVFTVPKSGLYIIFCNVVADYQGNFWAKIIINGRAKAGVMAYYGSSLDAYHTGSNLIVQHLQVNDFVWVQSVNGNSHLYSNLNIPDTILTVVMIKSSE